jgi:hypothetical protein
MCVCVCERERETDFYHFEIYEFYKNILFYNLHTDIENLWCYAHWVVCILHDQHLLY